MGSRKNAARCAKPNVHTIIARHVVFSDSRNMSVDDEDMMEEMEETETTVDRPGGYLSPGHRQPLDLSVPFSNNRTYNK